jgi:uncharacterized protein YdeI (YjbR/CyaY-like superfamily)
MRPSPRPHSVPRRKFPPQFPRVPPRSRRHIQSDYSSPAELQTALTKSPAISQSFNALSYSHKKEYVDWIDSAKKPETRQKRIEKMAEMLAAHKTPKG